MRILFFGPLSEIAGQSEIELQGVKNTDALRQQILHRFPAAEKQPYSIAINKKIESGNQSIEEGDVVALLPPFSGG